ncbi:MAG: DUF3306 domain-containing protein [Phreatobacter sp.]|uniref:DUF3306 domain-containing protein n=1 Tax=Phreatobacter sp. TaxID=1966341 RepID=UPI001A3BD11B|nr:DUF3306 domain-containing protein [Phreatobacter sp.]MBL8569450.1 DUF3306 domain-containing protein [Phreatobacter sp.]
MSSRGEGFLSRWSRLKREPDAGVKPAPAAGDATPPEPALPEGKTLDELIAELPRVEDLVPGQRLTAFMQPWVPASVRNAALQRMWLLDPAIRDYVSPALDYAYDYNTPGGAPGFGPLETSSDAIREVAEMFDRALGQGGAKEAAAAPERHDNLSQGNDEARPDDIAPQQSEDARADVPEGGVAPVLTTSHPASLPWQGSGTQADAAMHSSDRNMKELRPAGRRHGGALPG